jgi:hypothetical protein
MARRQTNVWLALVKWLLVPATLAVTGYLFLGPVVPTLLPGRAPITTPEATTSGEEKKTFQEPDVQVSVKPAGRSNRSSGSRRRKRRKPRHQPVQQTAPVEAPVDDGPPPDDPPVTDPTTGGGQITLDSAAGRIVLRLPR